MNSLHVTVFGLPGTDPQQPVGGMIRLEMDRLILEAAGQSSTPITFSALQAELGGIEQNQVILSTRHPVPLRIYLQGQETEQALWSVDHASVHALKEQVGVLRQSRFKSQWGYRLRFGSRLAGGVVAFVAVYWGALFLVAEFAPVSWENKLGQFYSRSFEKKAVPDAVASQALQRLGLEVAGKHTQRRYAFRFRVIADPTVNAFALPGGYIGVHTGMIAQTGSPEELAGVLSHEIQHVLHRHSLRALVYGNGFSILAALVFGDSRAVQAAGYITDLQFSRSQEKEADLGGLALLQEAGLDGAAWITLFEKLDKNQNHSGMLLQYMSTHPADRTRMEYLTERIAKAPKATHRIVMDWLDFKKRCSP